MNEKLFSDIALVMLHQIKKSISHFKLETRSSYLEKTYDVFSTFYLILTIKLQRKEVQFQYRCHYVNISI